MPRLSLFKPEKGNDYKFIDRQASEMFQVGGTDVYVHKYTGTQTTDESGNIIAKDITQIQDLMFLENRDRKYDSEVYRIRGIYNVQNIDFNLSAFGLFIDNDTLFMTVHINDFIKYIGRKPISGDVLELPHLRDDFALDDHDISLPRYYVIEDVGRASEGFSATWYPHLYRLKLKRITDSQQFADILNQPALDSIGNPDAAGTTLKDLLSTYSKELLANDAILSEAEADASQSGYQTEQFYTLSVDANTGKTALTTVDSGSPLASVANLTTLDNGPRPIRSGYSGYLLGDGYPPNGYTFGSGIQFPADALAEDFFLRTDFLPNRLFKFNGTSWVKIEDAVRMTLTNEDPTKPVVTSRQTQKTSFINNDGAYIYTSEVAVDYVLLDSGDTVVTTVIPYSNLPNTEFYVVLKLSVLEISYTDSEVVFSNVNDNLVITLPTALPESGQWKVGIYNHREAQKQSLSKALRPKARLQSDL